MANALCGGCRGVLLRSARRCPNCGRAVTPAALRVARGALVLAGSGVAAVTLMACYGMACTTDACREPVDQPPPTDSGHEQYYQYCPFPDGGLYPCWPDGGEVDLDAGTSELDGGDGGTDAGDGG